MPTVDQVNTAERPSPTAARSLAAAPTATLLVLLTACTPTNGPSTADQPGSPPTSAGSAPGSSASPASGSDRIRIRVGSTATEATLNDSATAQDLASRVPVTLTFRTYDRDEKVAHIAPALSTDGVPASADPQPGDLGYYAPDANVVLYNGDVASYPGIVRIGRIQYVDAITNRSGDFQVTIEAASGPA